MKTKTTFQRLRTKLHACQTTEDRAALMGKLCAKMKASKPDSVKDALFVSLRVAPADVLAAVQYTTAGTITSMSTLTRYCGVTGDWIEGHIPQAEAIATALKAVALNNKLM